MPRFFLIGIDRNALRRNMTREHGREIPESEVEAWLIDAGFVRKGDRWLAEEKNLGVLDPAEVTSADEVVGDDLKQLP